MGESKVRASATFTALLLLSPQKSKSARVFTTLLLYHTVTLLLRYLCYSVTLLDCYTFTFKSARRAESELRAAEGTGGRMTDRDRQRQTEGQRDRERERETKRGIERERQHDPKAGAMSRDASRTNVQRLVAAIRVRRSSIQGRQCWTCEGAAR